YSKLELLDTSTYDFAKKATERFKEHFGQESSKIVEGLRKFADVPVTLQVRVNSDHFGRLYKEQGWYRLVVDGKQLVSTLKLITWFSVSDDFHRVAYFETDGSDEGTLHVLKDGSLVESHEGFFHQVIFLEDGYYAVQSFRGRNRPEGVPLNAQRVMLNGRIAWGSDVSEDEFISISIYKDECLV
ncbi:peptidase, S9A/B/C family, catalytic domain protein, partial [mine drainage metagenome]